MKVLLVNGSPHEKGCTYTALTEVAGALEKQGVETEIFQLGTKPISGCLACGSCRKTGKCFMNDTVNEFLEKAAAADGFIFGTPVHFASASGALTSFMDRAFFAGLGSGLFSLKPAAAISSARRGGTTATFDQVNKYFTISSMPVV
ncbi:MAG TPA: flavodoxin family protein, partial [Clostridia bacterium]